MLMMLSGSRVVPRPAERQKSALGRLEHVRRWSFAQPILFSRQVRRLITDANGNGALARDEGLRALAWAEAAS